MNTFFIVLKFNFKIQLVERDNNLIIKSLPQ
jgi:hypothetical protein